MSNLTLDSLVPSSATAGDEDAVHAEAVRNLIDGTRRSDHWLIRASDWCSPILVKEVRQALKSRQFNWTLVLLMVFIAIWTGFAITSMLPGIYYFPFGGRLLFGYFFLLLVPTIVVVPNSAYRSMASELEQGTFDVLTITPLSPLKIVIGKLAVAMVQSLIFFSALAPCMALSYILRGVPIMGIANVLGWTALFSLMTSSIGILLATGNRNRAFGTFLSIVMILICFAGCFILYIIFYASVGPYSSINVEGIFVSLVGGVIVTGYTSVFLLAASAAIGVAGENYSTRIRWCILFISWIWTITFILGTMFVENRFDRKTTLDEEPFMALAVVLAIHWALIGTFLVAERGVTSPRAQRRLPDTLLGRVFLSWLNPGSGTGYVFTITSFAGCIGGLFLGVYSRFNPSSQMLDAVIHSVMLMAYLVIYVGLTRLVLVLLDLFPKLIGSRMLMAPCLSILFLLVGTISPLLLSGFWNGTGVPTYEWYTVINPFWTFGEFKFPELSSQILLIAMSVIVFGLNFVSLGRDVIMVRVEAPPRVREEQAIHTEIKSESPF
jgi:hypothetical protein